MKPKQIRNIIQAVIESVDKEKFGLIEIEETIFPETMAITYYLKLYFTPSVFFLEGKGVGVTTQRVNLYVHSFMKPMFKIKNNKPTINDFTDAELNNAYNELLRYFSMNAVSHSHQILSEIEMLEMFKRSPIFLSAQEVPTDHWQLCPKCNGQGFVSKPSHIPGDVSHWDSSTGNYECNVCNGHKIISSITGLPSMVKLES